jgi:hypothetical protein
MPHCLDLHDVERMTPAAEPQIQAGNLAEKRALEYGPWGGQSCRSELPVRIEKYDLHVNRQNTDA